MKQLWDRRQVLQLCGISGVVALVGGLSGCGKSGEKISANTDTGAESKNTDPNRPLVIGASNYYSAGIIAEIYAQVIERNGVFVERKYALGTETDSLRAVIAGEVDVAVTYTGESLKTLPDTVTQLAAAPASDGEIYCVTDADAIYFGLEKLGDMARLGRPVRLAGNSELAERAYGPKGLQEKYDLKVEFTAINDNGGMETITAAKTDKVDLIAVRSTSPLIRREGLIPLTDSQGLLPAQNVTGVASARVTPQLLNALNQALEKLDEQTVKGLNMAVIVDDMPVEQVAADWIANNL